MVKRVRLRGGAASAPPLPIIFTWCVTKEDSENPQTFLNYYKHDENKIVYDKRVWCADTEAQSVWAIASIVHETVHCGQTSGVTHNGVNFKDVALVNIADAGTSATTTQNLATHISMLELSVHEMVADVAALQAVVTGEANGTMLPGDTGRTKFEIGQHFERFYGYGEEAFEVACDYEDGTSAMDKELQAYKAKLGEQFNAANDAYNILYGQ